ncbi:hypothetical protein GQ457_09G022580 [Hibiscus cannabinus]
MAQSIDKPPYFIGEHYFHWKNNMVLFIRGKDYHLWDLVEDGSFVPTRSKAKLNANDKKMMELNCKALHILFYALDPDEYAKVYSFECVKEVCDKLEVIHEGINEMNEHYKKFLTVKILILKKKIVIVSSFIVTK